jgi:hypothetical protein
MRLATENDLPAIVSKYNSTIPSRESTADTVEVTVESRKEWFDRHIPDKRPLMVQEQDEKVVAWVSFQLFYGRPYDHTAEVSIYGYFLTLLIGGILPEGLKIGVDLRRKGREANKITLPLFP